MRIVFPQNFYFPENGALRPGLHLSSREIMAFGCRQGMKNLAIDSLATPVLMVKSAIDVPSRDPDRSY
jgi:hypothetical protein